MKPLTDKPSSDFFLLLLLFFAPQAELMDQRPKPPLLEGSVPTLFGHNNFRSKVKKRVVSEERKKRKEKDEVTGPVLLFLVFFLEKFLFNPLLYTSLSTDMEN